jgi:MFS family permease
MRRPEWASVAWWRRPVGTVYLASLVLSVGRGAWYACWALFFINSVGLSTAEFAVGITAAGVVGMIAGGPLGYLADRWGPKETLLALGVVEGLSMLSFLFVDGFWGAVVVTSVLVTAERAMSGVRTAVVAGMVRDEERLHSISTSLVMTQAGLVVGAGFAAIVLAADSRPGYVALVLFCGTANLAFVWFLRRVPHVESLRDRKLTRSVLVLRDRPFLVLILLNGLLALCYGMLSSGVPLWLAHHTDVHPAVISVLHGINAVTIVLFQNRVTRAGQTVRSAGRLGLWSGVLLAVSCVLFATSYEGGGAGVLAVLVVAAFVHVVGELYFTASGIGISVGLTREGAHGEYQGAFNTGANASIMFAPGIMTVLLVDWNVVGWFVLGVVFLVAGAGTMLVAGREERVRAAAVEPTGAGVAS